MACRLPLFEPLRITESQRRCENEGLRNGVAGKFELELVGNLAVGKGILQA